jgi:DNA-binding CsgD family transcriptional regulator
MNGLASNSHLRAANAATLVSKLSVRQRDVLEGITAGLLNKQIAYNLHLSEKTVKMHRALLLEALDVGSSAEAIRVAVEASFADPASFSSALVLSPPRKRRATPPMKHRRVRTRLVQEERSGT